MSGEEGGQSPSRGQLLARMLLLQGEYILPPVSQACSPVTSAASSHSSRPAKPPESEAAALAWGGRPRVWPCALPGAANCCLNCSLPVRKNKAKQKLRCVPSDREERAVKVRGSNLFDCDLDPAGVHQMQTCANYRPIRTCANYRKLRFPGCSSLCCHS